MWCHDLGLTVKYLTAGVSLHQRQRFLRAPCRVSSPGTHVCLWTPGFSSLLAQVTSLVRWCVGKLAFPTQSAIPGDKILVSRSQEHLHASFILPQDLCPRGKENEAEDQLRGEQGFVPPNVIPPMPAPGVPAEHHTSICLFSSLPLCQPHPQIRMGTRHVCQASCQVARGTLSSWCPHPCIFPSYVKQAELCPQEHSVQTAARGSGDLVIKGIFQLAVPWITYSGKPAAIPGGFPSWELRTPTQSQDSLLDT